MPYLQSSLNGKTNGNLTLPLTTELPLTVHKTLRCPRQYFFNMPSKKHFRAGLVALASLPFLVFATASQAESPTPDPALLTINRIYKSGEFNAKSYSARWVDFGDETAAYTHFEKSADVEGARDIVLHDAETDETRVLVSASDLIPASESKPLSIDGHQWSKDGNLLLIFTNTKRVWRNNTRGDYWILDRSSRQLTKLGGVGSPSTMMFAKISPDGKHVAYVRDRNIFIEDLYTNHIRQLTHADNDDIINGTTDWVYEEEFGLRDAFKWSPDSESIAYWQVNTSEVQRFPLINNTDSLYPTVFWFPYPKVGQRNPLVRVGVVDISTQATNWISLPGDPREYYVPRMHWIGDSGRLLIQQMNRLQNTNRVFVAHSETGDAEELFVETDDAWVDVHDELNFIDGSNVTWMSDRDGWRHAYLTDLQTGEQKLITPGQFDVIQLLHVDQDSGHVYFIASPNAPTERYLWVANLQGGEPQRVTPSALVGSNSYRISNDGKFAVHSHSSADLPPVTSLISLPNHETIRVLEDNKKLVEKIDKLAHADTEFFRVDIGEDVGIDGWCIKPPNMNPQKKYPLLCYVYGEPAGSTVVNRWGGSSYLWHLMLAQKGYVVMSFDNRGTKAPRGRAFRKSIYKKIGILPPADQAAAVRAVAVQRPYIDISKVAVWGWSGGGSSSLQAIFKYPELYKTAIAIAPVPNQRYYDTIYQERYMSLPELNVEGFREGSAINYAKQLKGNLLLVHGTADDNCHYQTTEMLIDELVKHDKQFTMFAYPNRTHSIRERKNTTRHLRTMMTNFLLEKMPPNE